MPAPNELSFLPDDYLERKLRQRTNVICGVLFFVVICVIGSAFTISERSMKEIDKQYADVQQQYTEAAKKIDQVTKMQEKQRTMAHQAELTAALLEKVPRSYLLAALTNGMPAGVSLLEFTLDSRIATGPAPKPKTAFEQRKAEIDSEKVIGGLQANEPRRYDVTMKVTGVAHNDVQVAQFIAMLNRSPLLSDVNLLITDEFVQGN